MKRTTPNRPAHRWLPRILRDERGQGMTEYVILSGVLVMVAAYLWYPDNKIFYNIRKLFDSTSLVTSMDGP